MPINIHNNIKPVVVIPPQVIGSAVTLSGIEIDRAGFGGVEFLISYGEVTEPGVKLDIVIRTAYSEKSIDWRTRGRPLWPSPVPRVDGISKNYTVNVCYYGQQRFVTLDLVCSGTPSTGCVSVTALLHSPANGPVPNP